MEKTINLSIAKIYDQNTEKAESGILSIFQALSSRYGFDAEGISYQTPSEDTLCIQKIDHRKWEIFYFERGHRRYLRSFSNVIQACFELLDRVIADQETLHTIKNVFTTTILLQNEELGIQLPQDITKYLIDHGSEGYRHIVFTNHDINHEAYSN